MKQPIADAGSSPFSPGLRVAGFVYLAGQGGFEDGVLVEGGVAAEARQAFRTIASLLGEAGGSLDDVVSCVVHLADLDELAALNEVWRETFTGVPPVRTTVRADLLAGMQVEITVVAHVGSE